ncbi:MAG: hypothetical protein JKY52_19165 [Flavobacteriales bacterium]|nr:hypothetical protein [Flavobacteriales bacterium]
MDQTVSVGFRFLRNPFSRIEIIDPPPKLFIGGAEVPSKGKPNTKKILNIIHHIRYGIR